MTAYRARALLFAFLFIFVGVAGNAMLFQGKGLRWGRVALLTSRDATDKAPNGGKKVRAVRRELPRWRPVADLDRSNPPERNRADAVLSNDVLRQPLNAQTSVAVPPASRKTVRAIQRELTQRGYEPGPVDGILGIMTRAAVMAYEADERLALTGVPSNELLERIVLGGTSGEAGAGRGRPGAHARLISKSVQQTLARLGYAPGPADGIVSTNTSQAIKKFEKDHGLAPTGRISGRMIAELGRANGSRFSVAAGW